MKKDCWVSRSEDEYGNVIEGHYIQVESKEILNKVDHVTGKCSLCSGTGKGPLRFAGVFYRLARCPDCNGSGKL